VCGELDEGGGLLGGLEEAAELGDEGGVAGTAWRLVGLAAQARAEALPDGVVEVIVKGDVLRARGACRARRTAHDAGRRDGVHEGAVGAGVTAGDRGPARVREGRRGARGRAGGGRA